jgi:PAS domain S-box-containing protein
MSQQDEIENLRAELTRLKSQFEDTNQQLRMRESERDLLAVMLHEAETLTKAKPDSSVNVFARQGSSFANRYAELFDRVRVGVVLASNLGIIETANQGMKPITGYSRMELCGKKIGALFSAGNEQEVLEKIIDLPSTRLIETELFRKAGDKVPVGLIVDIRSTDRILIVVIDFSNRLRLSLS